MKLRVASSGDAHAIAALHAASWKSTYANVLQSAYLSDVVPFERQAVWQQRLGEPRASQRVMVAEHAGKVVGFACAFVDEDPSLGSYLENLHVAIPAQGGGAGTLLIGAVATICSEQAVSPRLYLSVNQDNTRAQRFYRGLGALNAAHAVWNAPDGSAVPTFRFEWTSVTDLAQKTREYGGH